MSQDSTANRLWRELTKGLVRENPILVIMLGLCAALACSTSASDALGMGIAFSFVMLGSNIVVSLIRKAVPSQVRIPVFIIVISTFVTIVDMLPLDQFNRIKTKISGIFNGHTPDIKKLFSSGAISVNPDSSNTMNYIFIDSANIF